MKTKKTTSPNKKPWPTKAAMEQVYDKKLWGGTSTDFYSGTGSHDPQLIRPYIDLVTSFLTSFKKPLTVVDLGCGDFNVGKELVQYTESYIAVDIVNDLITRNKKLFTNANLQFHCLDIAKDELPAGDCVLLRQVLQHLSNKEIINSIEKLYSFKYVLLTEHIPIGEFNPNMDIISGQGIRLKKNSGVDLLSTPFNLTIKKESQLLKIPMTNGKGVICTTLYTMF